MSVEQKEIYDRPVEEAFAIIDKELGKLLGRELVSSGEVSDILLDIRSLLVGEKALLHASV